MDTQTGSTRKAAPLLDRTVAIDSSRISGTVPAGKDAGEVLVVDMDGNRQHVVYRPHRGEQVTSIVVATDPLTLLIAVAGPRPRIDRVTLAGTLTQSTSLDTALPIGRDVYVDRTGRYALVWQGPAGIALDDLQAHRVRMIEVPAVPRDGGEIAVGLSEDGRYALVARRNVDDQHTYYLLATDDPAHLDSQSKIDAIYHLVT